MKKYEIAACIINAQLYGAVWKSYLNGVIRLLFLKWTKNHRSAKFCKRMENVLVFANTTNLPVEVETCKMQTRRMANEAADIKLQTLGHFFAVVLHDYNVKLPEIS